LAGGNQRFINHRSGGGRTTYKLGIPLVPLASLLK
jgi:hypothetical protein